MHQLRKHRRANALPLRRAVIGAPHDAPVSDYSGPSRVPSGKWMLSSDGSEPGIEEFERHAASLPNQGPDDGRGTRERMTNGTDDLEQWEGADHACANRRMPLKPLAAMASTRFAAQASVVVIPANRAC